VGGVWKKCEKLLKKKKRSSKFFRTEILEVGLRPKKGRQIFRPAAPRKLISPYALGGGRKILKFALGAEMASYGPDDDASTHASRRQRLFSDRNALIYVFCMWLLVFTAV
jgi:hypothetical protein